MPSFESNNRFKPVQEIALDNREKKKIEAVLESLEPIIEKIKGDFCGFTDCYIDPETGNSGEEGQIVLDDVTVKRIIAEAVKEGGRLSYRTISVNKDSEIVEILKGSGYVFGTPEHLGFKEERIDGLSLTPVRDYEERQTGDSYDGDYHIGLTRIAEYGRSDAFSLSREEDKEYGSIDYREIDEDYSVDWAEFSVGEKIKFHNNMGLKNPEDIYESENDRVQKVFKAVSEVIRGKVDSLEDFFDYEFEKELIDLLKDRTSALDSDPDKKWKIENIYTEAVSLLHLGLLSSLEELVDDGVFTKEELDSFSK